MKEKILSIDSSTKSTGWALFENEKLVDYGVIDLSKVKNAEERYTRMLMEIHGLIELLKPKYVCAELTVVLRNPQVQRTLTQILGGISAFCILDNISWNTLRPTEWRKYVKDEDEKLPRKREELKQWSLEKVNKKFGLSIHVDDISDAILVGQAFINKN